MKVNRQVDYAARTILALSKHPFGTRLPTALIQKTMLVPRAFLQRIIAGLSKAHLITTFPGPNGGIELARPAAEISLRHIWEAVEGPLLISDCLKAAGECPFEGDCPVRARWARLQALMVAELEATSMDQLAQEAFAQEVISRSQSRRYSLPINP